MYLLPFFVGEIITPHSKKKTIQSKKKTFGQFIKNCYYLLLIYFRFSGF